MNPVKRYLRIGLGVLLLAWAGYTWYLSNKVDTVVAEKGQLTAQIEQATAANQSLEKSLNDMVSLRKRDHELLSNIHTLVTTVDGRLNAQGRALDELERTNEDVQTYLSQSPPDELLRMLNSEGSDGQQGTD